MSSPVPYIRERAKKLRTAASKTTDPEARSDYKSGARYLDLVADEIEAEFHIDDKGECDHA